MHSINTKDTKAWEDQVMRRGCRILSSADSKIALDRVNMIAQPVATPYEVSKPVFELEFILPDGQRCFERCDGTRKGVSQAVALAQAECDCPLPSLPF